MALDKQLLAIPQRQRNYLANEVEPYMDKLYKVTSASFFPKAPTIVSGSFPDCTYVLPDTVPAQPVLNNKVDNSMGELPLKRVFVK